MISAFCLRKPHGHRFKGSIWYAAGSPGDEGHRLALASASRCQNGWGAAEHDGWAADPGRAEHGTWATPLGGPDPFRCYSEVMIINHPPQNRVSSAMLLLVELSYD